MRDSEKQNCRHEGSFIMPQKQKATMEEKVNLAVIVCQRRLARVENEARHSTQHPTPNAPFHACKRDVFGHQSPRDGCVDGEKPKVARKTVEHSSDECFLARQSCHLAVGGVAEIGEHQQNHAPNVVREVAVMEHTTCAHAKENRQNRDDIRMNAQTVPKQRKHEADRSREVHVEPLLSVVRLE